MLIRAPSWQPLVRWPTPRIRRLACCDYRFRAGVLRFSKYEAIGQQNCNGCFLASGAVEVKFVQGLTSRAGARGGSLCCGRIGPQLSVFTQNSCVERETRKVCVFASSFRGHFLRNNTQILLRESSRAAKQPFKSLLQRRPFCQHLTQARM